MIKFSLTLKREQRSIYLNNPKPQFKIHSAVSSLFFELGSGNPLLLFCIRTSDTFVNLAESIVFREFAASNLALAVIAKLYSFRLIGWKIRCKGDRSLENDSLIGLGKWPAPDTFCWRDWAIRQRNWPCQLGLLYPRKMKIISISLPFRFVLQPI